MVGLLRRALLLVGSRARRMLRPLRAVPVLVVLALAVIVVPAQPAAAAPATIPTAAAADLCDVSEWAADITGCVSRLADVTAARAACVNPPPPDSPSSGLAGWFASQPEADTQPGIKGYYTEYGYAGYQYTTYDIGCSQTLLHPDYKFENTVANGEFLLASGILGASDALRERAWDPGLMWGWADPIVQTATQDIYIRVFTVFGGITLAITGIYLLWRSRQAQMSHALTTAGWAALVFIIVTGLASWPTFSAHLADNALVSSLDAVHNAVGPPSEAIPANECTRPDPSWCQDIRPPAVRASDTVVQSMLYQNWLRGLLGSSNSDTANKYGQALYEARTLSWSDVEDIHEDPSQRGPILTRKATQWEKVAQQIQTEDPEAYQYLQGTKGMDRIGAGFIALLSAAMFAMFDLTASLLVLLGFVIFRWAIIAAPVLGTVAILRPASAGFRRVINSVVAAFFNIVIFGMGAAIYLYAVDVIMGTTSLPGWLQVILVWLCGVVGWLLLRPYKRITELGGKNPTAAIAAPAQWHRRFFQGDKTVSAEVSEASASPISMPADQPAKRVEIRAERPALADEGVASQPVAPRRPAESPPSEAAPRRSRVPAEHDWDIAEITGNSEPTIYRSRRSTPAMPDQPQPRAINRAEAHENS